MNEALERYTLEAARLYDHLGPLTAGGVTENAAAIGAASVPALGLQAPLEIALAIWPFPLGDAGQNGLASLGYEPVTGFESAAEQRFFHPDREIRLFVVEAGSDVFTDRIIVRDFLRQNAEARAKFLEFYAREDDSPETETFLAEAQRWWVAFHGFAPVERIAQELHDFSQPWFISSGWALDIFLGRVTRVHHDVDVVIPRTAIGTLRRYLNARDWLFVLPLDGRLEPWPPESTQKPDIQMHAHREGSFLDCLLTEMDEKTWRYRRDPRITCTAAQAFLRTNAGLPYLAPELVMLFKSKNTSQNRLARPQDEQDFRRVLPHLSLIQRAWLREALSLTNPGHGWLEALG